MPTQNRAPLSDLRGIARMTIDATDSVAEVVENMHHTIQRTPLALSPNKRPGGITGFVYRCVRGTIRLVGQAVDNSLAGIESLLPEGDAPPNINAYRSAVNGVYGDYLLRTGNPLAIDMTLLCRGQHVDPHNPAKVLEEQADVSTASKLVVLVHGLCMNDKQWLRDGHDHGQALADEQGYLPLYLRYNSGLSIASNGQLFAEQLEMLVSHWPVPIDELTIIGHSMGGLVARSACHHGRQTGHTWLQHLHKLVFLGTPHHGAPLERGGHGLDLALQLSAYSIPLARLTKARSVGITDLRHGKISATSKFVPLPSGIKCYSAAAVRATKRSRLSDRLIGDGLVPLDSALGRHKDNTRTLKFPKKRQWVAHGLGHSDLLNCPDVYGQISAWLREPR